MIIQGENMYKRTVCLFTALCLTFSFVIYRIISLNYSDYSTADGGTATRTLTVGSSRGIIYDVNMKKLVNDTEKKIAVALPGADSIAAIEKMTDEENADNIISTLSDGFPCMFETETSSDCEEIEVFDVPVRYSDNQPASNIIGYLDNEGKGAFGIEKAFDSILSDAQGELSVTVTVDANGKMLGGISPVINNNNFSSPEGVVLTIDKDIQLIAEKAMQKIGSGGCVVLDCSDGRISAMVSTPALNPDNLAESLTDINKPFVNKALSAYSVGSVFKPILTAYALENNMNIEEFECKGSIRVNDTVFGCINRNPHGKIGLAESLQVSCNSFYINLTKDIDPERLSSFCSNFSFGTGITLADGIYAADGYLPDAKELENSGSRANFSFGQGKLTATPLQMAAAYNALVNGGYYKYPYLIAGTVDAEGKLTQTKRKPHSKILSESTSRKMRQLLESVVTEGNAYYGEALSCTCGGKTGTAQSGSYNYNHEEILRTWFVGFFPASDPLYVVAVVNENGVSGGKDCGPVFSSIADGVMELLIDRAN